MGARKEENAKMKTLILATLAVLLLQLQGAKAALVISYSLDVNSFSSTDIVEGTVTSTKQNDYWGILASTFKVTTVYKGRLKVGSTIQVALSKYYYLPSHDIPITKNSKQLSKGVHLLLFLEAAHNSRKIAGFSQLRSALDTKLIQGKTAYEWFQGESYNPAVATPIKSINDSAEVSIYRKQVRDSIKKTTVWQTQLKQPVSSVNAKLLFPILKQSDLWPLQPEVCGYLAKLGNLDLLLDALKLNLDYEGRRSLAEGFVSPEGRERLLSTLETLGSDNPFRLTLSNAINAAGLLYWSTNKSISGGKTLQSSDDNARYITRIVDLALRKRDDKQLCVSLLSIFPPFFPFGDASDFPDDEDAAEIIKDSETAVPLLVKLHHSTIDEAIRFGAERGIASLNRKTFARIFPQRGTVVSLIQFLSSDGYTEDPKGKIAFHYTIEILEETNKISKLRKLKPYVVFHHLDSHRDWAYETDINLEGAFADMSYVMKQPSELPSGKYRVYL